MGVSRASFSHDAVIKSGKAHEKCRTYQKAKLSLRHSLSLFITICSGRLWRLPRCCQGGAEGGRQPVCFLCPARHYSTGYPRPRCLLWREGPQATVDQGPFGVIHSPWHDWVSVNIPMDTDLPYGWSNACTGQVRSGVRIHVSPLRPFMTRGAHARLSPEL